MLPLKSLMLTVGLIIPTVSLAESALEYDFLQASFGKSKLSSPVSDEDQDTTTSSFTLQKDLGYQTVASISAEFIELRDRYEEDDIKYGADVDQRVITVALERYFMVSPTLHIVPGIAYSETKNNVETKFQSTDVRFFYSAYERTFTDNTIASLQTRYRLSEASPLELTAMVAYETGGEEDAILVDLSAALNISDILTGRFSYQNDSQNSHPAFLYGVRVYF